MGCGGAGRDGTQRGGIGGDEMGWDGMGQDGTGWNGMPPGVPHPVMVWKVVVEKGWVVWSHGDRFSVVVWSGLVWVEIGVGEVVTVAVGSFRWFAGRRMEPRNLSEPQGKAVYGIQVSA